eukprot:gene8828-biopygen4821
MRRVLRGCYADALRWVLCGCHAGAMRWVPCGYYADAMRVPCGPDGNWVVGDGEARMGDFKCTTGLIFCRTQHRGLLPDELCKRGDYSERWRYG